MTYHWSIQTLISPNATWSDTDVRDLDGSFPLLMTSALPALNIVTTVTGILLNLFVLRLYLAQKRLRKPFTVYLINLLLASLAFLLTNGPLSVINLHSSLRGVWCSIFIYTLNAPPGCIIYAHLLIVVNRLVALIRPICYRHYLHSSQVAVGLCAAAWVVVNVVTIPGVVIDGLYYQNPEAGACLLNVDQQLGWAVFGELLVGVLPILFMIVANVFLVCRGRRRLKSRTKRALSISWPETGPACSTGTPTPNNEHAQVCSQLSKEPERALVLLVSLTLSLVVCWVPGVCFMVVNSFTRHKHPRSGARSISDLLFLLQTVADPIVLILASPDLRAAVGQMATGIFCRGKSAKPVSGKQITHQTVYQGKC